MAGAAAERQETAVVKAINDAVKKNNKQPITVVAGGTKISSVTSATKFAGRQSSGSEPYTDVVLMTKIGKKVNLSLKGTSAPSLAGGGLRGLEAIVPGIAGRFMKTAYNHLIKMGLKDGDKVPDVYGKIDDATKEKVVVGTPAMGGPINYMYIGPMDVKSTYDANKNILTLNGTLTEAKKYAKEHELYFRLRARREDQRFDTKAMSLGIPKIYGKSPSKGDSAGRIVVTDSVPKTGVVVKLK